MQPQKIQVIPEIQNLSPSSPKPLVFWKRIKQNQEKELHLFLLLEGRTDAETRQLGKEFWEVVSANTNELAINQKGFSNPEYVCEAILKIGNEFLTTWSRQTQIDNWSDISLIIAVATPQSIYFARLGKARIFLFRSHQIILADENLSYPRSPQFSPPFSELAGGSLKLGDRIIFASAEIMESFSREEISSLAVPSELTQAFYNIVRSLEVAGSPKNAAFILGDVVPFHKPEEQLQPTLEGKLKEARIGELHFREFNPIARQINVSSPLVPWKEILSAFWKKLPNVGHPITKFFAWLLRPLAKKISSLSLARKAILFSFLVFFVAFAGLLVRSLTYQPPTAEPVKTDFKAIYDRAEQLREEASAALIYQDENKARESLMQADSLLEQASTSGEWGIKAIKLRQELNDQLATLDKAQPTETKKIWSLPEDQGSLIKISLQNNQNILAVAGKSVWSVKAGTDNPQADKLADVSINCGQSPQEKCWLLSTKNGLWLSSSKDRVYFIVDPIARKVSEKKELSQEAQGPFSAAASFDSAIYFFNLPGTQIKQFSLENNELKLSRDWLKQDLEEDFKDDTVVSMSIDGSIFAVTQKGNLLRLSGGKKTSWNAERPGSSFQGDKLALFTKPEYKNLYLLDPEKKRVIVFEKESGKLKGQAQNISLGQAIDFQVDEGKKEVYFVTPRDLYQLNFEIN